MIPEEQELTPKEEMKKFRHGTPLMERNGVYFLKSQAKELLRLMKKHLDHNRAMIFHSCIPKLEDLIGDEIEDAIKANTKNLKSKKEKHTIARLRYAEIESDFFKLFD